MRNGPKADASSEGGNTIRVVSARTGLAMETLRAWERRYGFPLPERREGSNRRLYSGADVERLMAIQRAIARGYRIGDVVGKTIVELDALAPTADELRPAASSVAIVSGTELVALLARDELREIETHLRHAAVMLGPRRFVTDVAHPFAVAVGQGWVDGLLTIGHEHLATECLVTQIRQMLASYQEIDGRPLVLLSTLPGEPHTLPLQMVALYLVAIGARPRLLGASTPPRELAECARTLGADVVGLTITGTGDRAHARRDLQVLQKALPARVPLWLGGGGAAAVAPAHERALLITSWDALDEVVSAHRAGSRPPRGAA